MSTCSSCSLLPDPRQLKLQCLVPAAGGFTLIVSATQPRAPCPLCGRASMRVHSRYQRTVADLPLGEIPVLLLVRARKLFCDTPTCPCRIFTERLPGVVARYARKTERLQAVFHLLGYHLGGEAGARVAARLMLSVSAPTLLRQVRRQAPAASSTPRVLGVDDFALRRGHRYGTLLVDLERHRPADLLPDRTAETLEKWLQAHPGVQVISRDRAEGYADGASKGAPAALQVADRWHLMKSVADVLEKVLGRERPAIKQAARLLAVPAQPPPRTPSRDERKERDKAVHRQQRLARYARLQALRADWSSGRCGRELAQQVGISPATLYRWLKTDCFPERKPLPRRPRLVDAYVPYLQERWAQGCRDAGRLWREIAEQGFAGTYTMVDYLLRDWWGDAPRQGKARDRPVPVPSSKETLWLLLRTGEALDENERAFVDELCRLSPAVAKARELALDFFALVRQRRATALEGWFSAAETSRLPEWESCCSGMRRDQAAIAAALEYAWSNAQTEGQVTRLKLVKRGMYGRATFDLLRARVLPMASA
jgi:transposase